jgi:hypothetical protein
MDTKERKTPVSGALFSPPDPELATGTAASGKKRLRRGAINFKCSRIFFAIFHRLILRCSLCSETLQPGFGLTKQTHQRCRSSVVRLGSSSSFLQCKMTRHSLVIRKLRMGPSAGGTDRAEEEDGLVTVCKTDMSKKAFSAMQTDDLASSDALGQRSPVNVSSAFYPQRFC